MKKLILVVALIIGSIAYSQEINDLQEKKSPEERVENQLQKMTVDLKLDQQQVAVVRELLLNQSAKRQEKLANFKKQKEAQTKISRDDRKLLAAEMKQNQAELKDRMKSVLNADQYAKWEKNRDEQQAKMIEKIKERRGAK